MGTRDLLGIADVGDSQLTGMVASLLREEEVHLLDVTVDEVDYHLPAITTGGRWWVSGHAAVRTERAPFRLFVKQVQSWERHPFFAFVPEEFQEIASSSVPWKTEAEVYRSDAAQRLPEGLAMPRALGVFDLDATASSIWLEEVPVRTVPWDRARYERAAYLLGRFSGSRELAPLAGLRDVDWTLGSYAAGRLDVQVKPLLLGDDIWQHPLTAAFDEELRDGLRAAIGRAHELAADGDALPYLLSHGDACPNNLLAADRDDELVMIDFGFWGAAPVGFDLTQLLVGDVQLGKRTSDDLAELDEALVTSYVAGLRAEGCEVPEEDVRRGHALCMLVMTGLSTVPFDLFDGPVTPETQQVAAARADLARYALALADASSR
jgi:hypothetical protein